MSLNAYEESFRNTAIVVTGAAGFIGSHLVEHLVTLGAKVTAVDNLQAGSWANLRAVSDRVVFAECDVRDADAMGALVEKVQPNYVFHLAANASVPGSVQDPVYDFEANCVGTFRVLNALRGQMACRKVVVASSGAVYGEPEAFPITEESPLRPISPYGASKLNTEITAQMMHRVYQVPVVIARLFNAYGPRMARFVVLDFLKKLQRDPYRLEVLGTGQQIRDFTYVADTVQGLLALALKGDCGEAYNVSSGKNCSVTDLANAIIAARGLSGKTRIEYTGKSWVGDAQRWEVSITRLKALGYQPQYTLEEGLRETIVWFDTTYGPTAM
ncbi:nucleoside-diphosphate-sugar epimerase [Chthonomonas calidirosea]|uniref:Nucleoside-diphosphate-sugar epimerases n=1 Tax=Chthonomonas calidirosea (strain DSM 23976 / ICMP 18418 / T49) TaxID=1303518 RepID=S0EWS9_CHTCT|nr:SDR family NAD(P)-dependent oxidoreductase [Chthonomonas calidirosea]CCW36224.1 Nucleoside-diphosphate-sugar epimerases [Chthonomonas calidirosea T49]CEK16906.1 nucleoside-diphosphate-sugar epimerase [Chthonomonas calidirosea]CEK17969.1 nucleoside-diphosphate-sugar epimerase [Chthonomonas calidirosea]